MKVLLTGAYQYSNEQICKIEQLGWEVIFIKNELTALDIPVDEFEAVVCNALFLYNDITKFKKLKMVQATSAGLERLPIEYMKENQILYYNAKDVYSIPMAEWAVMNVLEFYKNAYSFFEKQQNKKWEKDRTLQELTNKKVCIVGYGSVGREIAKRLSAFGAEITAVNRSEPDNKYIQKWNPLEQVDQVLSEADIIILSIALAEETKNLINQDRLNAMKQDSVLINISRGEILDQDVLLQLLKKGKFRGVALDVFKEEPLSESNELWELPQVIITPHNSFMGDKVRERMFNVIYHNLKSVGEQANGVLFG